MADKLSPAAQAVWLAAWQHSPVNCETAEDRRRQQIAAALRAAADQVVPDDPGEAMHFTTEAIRLNRMGIRASLIAIAAELEARP